MPSRTSLSEPLTLLQAAAFTEWYEALAPHLVNWLTARGPFAASMAEDIVQDAFVRVLGHVEHLSAFTDAHRRNYVFTIAAHVLADRVRDTARRNDMSGGAATPTPFSAFREPDSLATERVTASDDWTASAQQMEQTTAARLSLKAIWERVPVEMRELLLMTVYGYSRAEMATWLHISEGAVSQRLYALRRMLRAVKEQVA